MYRTCMSRQVERAMPHAGRSTGAADPGRPRMHARTRSASGTSSSQYRRTSSVKPACGEANDRRVVPNGSAPRRSRVCRSPASASATGWRSHASTRSTTSPIDVNPATISGRPLASRSGRTTSRTLCPGRLCGKRRASGQAVSPRRWRASSAGATENRSSCSGPPPPLPRTTGRRIGQVPRRAARAGVSRGRRHPHRSMRHGAAAPARRTERRCPRPGRRTASFFRVLYPVAVNPHRRSAPAG